MIHLRDVLFGMAALFLGTPIALIIWAFTRPQRATLSFSPMGLTSHLTHSLSFWVLIIALFIAGVMTSVFSRRKTARVA